MAYGVVYLITNLVNGKVYVGQTTRAFRDRWGEHVYGTKGCKQAVRRAIVKYGVENFSFAVIGEAANRDALDNLEKLWIILLASNDKRYGYNVTTGGKGFKHSPETKEKLRLSSTGRTYPQRRGIPNHFRGKKHTAESRRKMSVKLSGENHPNWGKTLMESTRGKISEAANSRSKEQIAELGRQSRGTTRSPEVRKKMSEARKRNFIEHPEWFAQSMRTFSDEFKKKQSEGMKKYFAEHPEIAKDRVARMAKARLGGVHA